MGTFAAHSRPVREEFHAEIKTLRLIEPFRIAHGESWERQVLRVHYRRGDKEAAGEAPFVPYYKEDPVETLNWVNENWRFNRRPEHGPKAGVLALNLLWDDWGDELRHCTVSDFAKAKNPMGALCRKLGLPKLPVLSKRPIPSGSRSLSIPTDMDEFAEKVIQIARQFRVLKLKLGSGNWEQDELIMIRARQAAPEAILFADANGGWNPDEAARIIPRLAKWKLQLIEQPVSHLGGTQEWEELRAKLPSSPLPLFADESVQDADDVLRLAPFIDGINVKLLKAGNLLEASLMISAARFAGKQVLLGCMIETSIGVTAAAHLAPYADWIDLDGHLWVANDDYEGIRYDEQGRLVMPDRPGIGVVRRAGDGLQ